MKRAAILLAIVFAVAVVVSGCGKQQEVVNTPDGQAKVTKTGPGSASVEIKDKSGKTTGTMTVDQGADVSEAEVGVPLYPNMKSDGTQTHESQGKKIEIFVFSTPDSFEDVSKFYKDNLKGVTNSFSTNQADTQAATYQIGESMKGTVVSVMADKKNNKTMVTITKY